MSDTYRPHVGDLVVGFDGYTRQSGQIIWLHVPGGVLVDTLGCGRAILADVQPAPADHPVHTRA